MNKIAVCLVTHNQDQYIAQAIDSVLMQQCAVSYTIFIGEDSSIDSTREIVLAYKEKFPDKIELVLNESNLGLVQNTINVFNRIVEEGYEYIAMLDGDDYWVDNKKLAKQFLFLQNNTNYGLVHTNIAVKKNSIIVNKVANPPQGDVFLYAGKYNIANCTVFFRTQLLSLIKYDDFIKHNFLSCDYVMYTIFASKTKFGFLNDITAVWRRGQPSVSNRSTMQDEINYVENDIRMWVYLEELFPTNFNYTELDLIKWRNFRIFNIAFKYNNFKLANEILHSNKLAKKRSVVFCFKVIAASNIVLFYIWIVSKMMKNYLLFIKYQISNIKYQISNIKYQISNIIIYSN